jgi:hypothetical protein
MGRKIKELKIGKWLLLGFESPQGDKFAILWFNKKYIAKSDQICYLLNLIANNS